MRMTTIDLTPSSPGVFSFHPTIAQVARDLERSRQSIYTYCNLLGFNPAKLTPLHIEELKLLRNWCALSTPGGSRYYSFQSYSHFRKEGLLEKEIVLASSAYPGAIALPSVELASSLAKVAEDHKKHLQEMRARIQSIKEKRRSPTASTGTIAL